MSNDPTPTETPVEAAPTTTEVEQVTEDLLVEDVSIDGMCGVYQAVETTAAPTAAGFDLDAPWRLGDRVSVRPEPFGALLYHFGTRRLTFLKSPLLLDVVRALGDHPTARAAVVACGVPEPEAARYATALASLVDGDMIVRR